MNQEILVSIIVPIYNVAPYLERCLTSIVQQTYKKLEIILIDDGSTDDSKMICNIFLKQDSRMIYYYQENSGLSRARNKGLEICKGDYVCFIDSDDFVNKVFVENLLSIAIENDSDIAICDYYSGTYFEIPNRKKIVGRINTFQASDFLNQWHGKHTRIETVAWNKIYKRELFYKGKQIEFPIDCFHEDVATTHLLVQKSKKITLTNKKLYVYFQRNSSISNSINEKIVNDSIFVQQLRMKFFKELGMKGCYRRLEIHFIKFCIKVYCVNYKNKINNLETENNFLNIYFKKNYKRIVKYSECKFWEKLLIYSFCFFPHFCAKIMYPIYSKIR